MLCADPETTEKADRPTAPAVSVIIPVHNGAAMLDRCLSALSRSRGVAWECIVVDDGSSDASATVAEQWGARVAQTGRAACGPGQARNLGAQLARASLLCFIDADVMVRWDTLAQFVALFEADSELEAAFGSYDTQPAEKDLFSQYRNLLHHFVHQTSREEACTFWAGCGAIRRATFLATGGFDPRYTRPSVEDIDLGFRLRASGARIRLAKHIQVTHLKRWTLLGIVKTDIRDRALPWSALIQRTNFLPDDLNLSTASRASAISVYCFLGLVALGCWNTIGWLAALVPVALLLTVNRGLYGFFLRQRGVWFLVRSIPLHWLYYAYSALAFGYATLFRTPTRGLGVVIASHSPPAPGAVPQVSRQSAAYLARSVRPSAAPRDPESAAR
jgi:glycosyltransferase involved in cell wall biosynthesis